ncbi:2-hydroxychromene-2-carboxylate isomerase [Alkalilimnicola sp. S0819]|uniref:2-hydroxychromene-2-carboxylate isomerase n=1 Tax=Alkalilimnicola sp. S0819 TaxID=2613922 RepID=UPI001261600C|nr:2-hydroxychromene-2-carboxylate isomerase [Alkalilimnicola sp. S0819]KAB7624289.1 2-hydroxychromene-2-carboxylate isomerase [Alkalilimnicola sp. S0819]MPQ16113.1 2-hydroxychromene-2-carboxylate isomerase [Alkalilimnicola sp. S0819]
MAENKLIFWFDFTSTYSFLSGMRIEEAARQAGVSLEYRPFLLGVVLRERGWENKGPAEFPVKVAYMWRDLERRAAQYGFGFRKPSVFPRHSLLADRVAIHAAAQGWVAAFTRACFAANFADDRDISDEAVLADLIASCGQDAAQVLAAAVSQPVKDRLKTNTAEALSRGIFGAPSFTVGEELFWGDDRLEDALAWAKSV